jgi:uncharacterized membrane protein
MGSLAMFKQFIRNPYLKIELASDRKEVEHLRTLDVAMTGVCAALYIIVGYVTNAGIVSPTVGVVRFWPAVIVPAVFAVLFGPWVGGVGAAIGIFFADMIPPSHGIPLLSVTAGVPSNFLMFYLIGSIGRKNLSWKQIAISLVASSMIAVLIAYLFVGTFMGLDVAVLFLGVVFSCIIIQMVAGYLLPEWRSFVFASIVGQAIGATWIGISLWAYSQVLPLPLSFHPWDVNAPFYASFFWLVWTFATEIPFIIVIDPPILKACYKAFPSLKPPKKE